MGVLFMVVVGAVLGWLTAVCLQIESRRGVLMNIAAGIGGALLAGLLIRPLLGEISLWGGDYRLSSLLVPLAGAVILLAALNLLHRSPLR